MGKTVHVCLVSDQTLANLIPALMEKPDCVWLICTKKMKEKGLHERLGNLLNSHEEEEAEIEIRFSYDAPDTGMDNIVRYANKRLEKIKKTYPDARITLNVTGGTKLMAMGFATIFREAVEKTIYTDTAHQRIEILPKTPHSSEETDTAMKMEDVLGVEKYLQAQGVAISSIDSDNKDRKANIENRADLTNFIGENITRLQAAIKVFNGIVSKAYEDDMATQKRIFTNPSFKLKYRPQDKFKEYIQKLVDKQIIINWDEDHFCGEFANEDAAKYLSGIWLEEYAWLCAAHEDCNFHDMRMGVHREYTDAGRDMEDREINEFDLLITNRNQLLYVECKTVNYQYAIGKANQDAYKLDSLSKMTRGLFGQTWLLSAIKPPNELLERAKNLNFRVLGPNEIAKLLDQFKNWKDGMAG